MKGMLGAVNTHTEVINAQEANIDVYFGKPVLIDYGDVKDESLGKLNGDKAYIGRGYDLVNGACFSSELLKDRVFTPRWNKVTFRGSNQSDDVSFSIVNEKSKISESLAASMKINAGFSIFKGEVKGAYDSTQEDRCETLYAVASYFYKKGVEDYEYGSAINLKEDGVLEPAFKKAINDFNVTPAQIVSSYGTHVLASGVVHGARLNYYLRTENINHKDTSKLKLALKTKFGSAFSAEGNMEATQGFEDEIKNTSYKFIQVGGMAAENLMSLVQNVNGFNEACQVWKKSLNESQNAHEIATVGSMVPLWELADDPVRKKQLEDYMTKNTDLRNKNPPLWRGYWSLGSADEPGYFIQKKLFTMMRMRQMQELTRVDPNAIVARFTSGNTNEVLLTNLDIFMPSLEDENIDIETALTRDYPEIATTGINLSSSVLRKYIPIVYTAKEEPIFTPALELRNKPGREFDYCHWEIPEIWHVIDSFNGELKLW